MPLYVTLIPGKSNTRAETILDICVFQPVSCSKFANSPEVESAEIKSTRNFAAKPAEMTDLAVTTLLTFQKSHTIRYVQRVQPSELINTPNAVVRQRTRLILTMSAELWINPRLAIQWNRGPIPSH